MANPTHVQQYGNQLVVLLDDGTRRLAYPTLGGLWIISGVDGQGPVINPPPAGAYKFPFPRSAINFESYYGHSGVDFPGSNVGSSSDIKAIGPGTVIDVNGPQTWAGNYVIIDHGTIGGVGIWSLYAHMLTGSLVVSEGMTVTGGQKLGVIGDTGVSEGTHLHLEVIYNGDRLETDTPGNHKPGLGFTRTLQWMDSNTDGSNW